MNFEIIISILFPTLLSISSIVIGLLVYARDRNSATHGTFFVLIIGLSFLVLSDILSYIFSAQGGSMLVYTIKLSYTAGIFGALAYLRFCSLFPRREYKTPWWEKLIYLSGAIVVFFIIFTKVIFPGIVQEYRLVSFVSGRRHVVVNNFYPYLLMTIWFVSIVFSSTGILINKLRKSRGFERTQLQYLLLGTGIFALALVLLGPVTTISSGKPVAGDLHHIGLLFFVGFTTYAIVKHRLMDIRLIILKSLAYSFLIAAIASIYIFFLLFLIDPIQNILKIPSNITLILISLLIAFGFPYFKKLVEKATDRIFYKGRYNPQRLLSEIGEIVNSTIILDELTNRTLIKLVKEMKIRGAAIILKGRSYKTEVIGLGEFSIKDDVLALASSRIILTDTINDIKQKEYLRKLRIDLIIPLMIEEKIIGYLVLGEKRSGDMYTAEDLNFLEILAHQLAVALNSAILYQNVVDDKIKIERLLEEQKKLDKLKSEFIAIATHEVNTPIAENEGYLSLVLSGKAGKINQEVRKYLESAYEASRKTYFLLKNMMEASQLEQGELPVSLKPFKIEEAIDEVVKKYLPQTKGKGIILNYKKSKKLPKVLADPFLIKEIIEELLKNSLKFTEKGAITISSEVKKDKVFISIKDSGQGIPKKDLPHIFDKFYQADTSYTREVGGTGLGLYVVKLLLKLHKENISVSSIYGIGSEFRLSLAVAR